MKKPPVTGVWLAKVVTVRVEPNVMHAYYDGVLIKSIPRTTQKEVKQLAAHDPHDRPNRS